MRRVADTQDDRRGAPTSAAAAWKISGAGFLWPTDSEITQPWTIASSPVFRIFNSCCATRPLVTITHVQPAATAFARASRVGSARVTRSAAPRSRNVRTASSGTFPP